MPQHSRLLVLSALLAFPACASRHEIGLYMPAGESTELLVGGDNPFVRIANDGPGRLDVVTTDGAGTEETLQLERGRLARSLRGGGALRLTAVGDAVNAAVVVDGSNGLSLRSPAPARPEAAKP